MISIEQQRDWAQQLLAASAAELTAVQPDWMSAARAAAVQALSTLPYRCPARASLPATRRCTRGAGGHTERLHFTGV